MCCSRISKKKRIGSGQKKWRLKKVLCFLLLTIDIFSLEPRIFTKVFTKTRVALKSYAGRVRYVMDKMTNPSKLLELAVLAVSSYDLPTNELPVELEILLHEGSTQTQANKLKEEIEILKREVPMLLRFSRVAVRIRHAS